VPALPLIFDVVAGLTPRDAKLTAIVRLVDRQAA